VAGSIAQYETREGVAATALLLENHSAH